MYRALFGIDSVMENPERMVAAVDDLPGTEIEAVLLNVFQEFEATGEGKVKSKEFFDEEVPDTVEAVEAALDELGIESTVRREHGDPAQEIIDVAREVDADVIVIGGRQHSPVGKVLFGSTTQSVLLNADRPITVVPPE